MIVAAQTAKPKFAPVVRRLRRQERGFDTQGAPENPDTPYSPEDQKLMPTLASSAQFSKLTLSRSVVFR